MTLPKDFIDELYNKHQQIQTYPSTSAVARLITKILLVLFPEQTKRHYESVKEIQDTFVSLEDDLAELLGQMQPHLHAPAQTLAQAYMSNLPEVYRLLKTDIQAILDGDPAAQSEFEVIRAYPGFYAIAFYRLANALHRLQVPLLPRVLTEYAHSKTGIDIHPAATIGEYFFIDHGTGIVIGETCDIGNRVKLYQGVTLGALSVSKDLASKKRHPTIEDGVVIYSGATILGGDTVVGAGSIIGGNVSLMHSVYPNSRIYR